jgi:hypothetical protein
VVVPAGFEKQCGVVTPTLMLGEVGSAEHLTNVVYLDDASDACTAIRCGLTVILPPGAWKMAEETLRLLGADEMVIEDRLHVAKTGRVLYAV